MTPLADHWITVFALAATGVFAVAFVVLAVARSRERGARIDRLADLSDRSLDHRLPPGWPDR